MGNAQYNVTMFKDVKAYFFDLDGTLVDSKLNFDKLRSDLGFPKGVPILEHIETLTCSIEIERANRIVVDHELSGAKQSKLFPGVIAFLNLLSSKNIPMAILTRNCREATEYMLKKHAIKIDHVITREDFPAKPNPDALLHLAKINNLRPIDCVYIGDFKFDIEAARNAGMQAAYFDSKDVGEYSHLADYTFSSFESLI